MRQIIIMLVVFLLFGCSSAYKGNLVFKPSAYTENAYSQDATMFFAELSKLAYEDENIVSRVAREQGLVSSLFTYDNGTQYIVMGNSDFMFIAFRGTEIKLKDIIIDLKLSTYTNVDSDKLLGLPAGHGGFRRGAIDMINNNRFFLELEEFKKKVQAKTGVYPTKQKIFLTGHSLGGALAILMAEPITRKGYEISSLYTFAAPLTMTKDESKWFNKKYKDITYTIVNRKDYVPRAAPSQRKNYCQIGQYYHINEDGHIFRSSPIYVKYTVFEKIKLEVFSEHYINSYIASIENANNSTIKVASRGREDISQYNDKSCPEL